MRFAAMLAAAMVLTLVAVTPAQAHVQVRPTVAAPGDPVMFEVLVPNERSASTVEVSLRIPDGVLPFSFERTPGWQRRVETKPDGTISVVRWRGRLDRDGFVRFAFLAGTPEQEGNISWSAVQRYSDGKESAWIGPPESEEPAAVTRITEDAPRANAGGEGADAPTSASASAAEDDDDGGDIPAITIASAGLLLGAIALGVALRGRRRDTSRGDGA